MGFVYLLLFLTLSSAWGQQSTSAPPQTTLITPTTTPNPPPSDVSNVSVPERTESSITLQWEQESNNLTYKLMYSNKTEENVVGPGSGTVTKIVSPLAPGTSHAFTLVAVRYGVRSQGYNFSAATLPSNAAGFRVTEHREDSVTLQWNSVESSLGYNLSVNDQAEVIVPVSEGDTQTFSVPSLSAGTRHRFTLFTVGVDHLKSTGTQLNASTVPSNAAGFRVTEHREDSVTLQWNSVESSLGYNLSVNDQAEVIVPVSEGDTQTFSVPSLSAGTRHRFTLFTVGVDQLKSSGTQLNASTVPSNAAGFRVTEHREDSVTLQWNSVESSLGYNLSVNDQAEVIVPVSEGDTQTFSVPSLSAGTRHRFTLFTVGVDQLKSTGTQLNASTVPSNAAGFRVTEHREDSVTLQWNSVESSLGYNLSVNDQAEVIVPVSEGDTQTFSVPSLSAGTIHRFTLFTVGVDQLKSTGTQLNASTAPLNVAGGIQVSERSQSSFALCWIPLNGVSSYTLEVNSRQIYIPADQGADCSEGRKKDRKYTVSDLEPGTEYNLTFFSVFEGVRSSGIKDFTVTRMNCPASAWNVTNTTIKANLQGSFTKATANNSYGLHTSAGGGAVSFTGLYPGSQYTVVLTYEREGRVDPQCEHTLTLVPPDLSEWWCDYAEAGYALSLSWAAERGEWTAANATLAGRPPQEVTGPNVSSTRISGLQPAKTYSISLVIQSGVLQSNTVVISCKTDPRGVIAGSVIAVLLLILLVGLAVFILRRKPELLKPASFSHSKISTNKMKAIPIKTFPEHYQQLCADQNRGFSEEYEDFAPVGTEQSNRAALDPDVKNKNRFTNVLPYDWSRVKLSPIYPDRTSDYINASYMPGYSSIRQYIAAQGPLPSTINDFWRMIWEQRVRGVVMVTNCVEGGRDKCERYWPLDSAPCLYGDLLVTITSQQKSSDWTLREFRVKHNTSGEERSVKHFHFTSWPDHGVPQGTTALIQFRQLVRQHMEAPGAGGSPTVVHCSAGVGRTGTLIALDVLLQQLEREKAVGIAAFVHKMRQSRPLMVQTESQYVYLHQCIMDSLEPQTGPSENLYENSDMIYANATALREFQKATSKVQM